VRYSEGRGSEFFSMKRKLILQKNRKWVIQKEEGVSALEGRGSEIFRRKR
jgi:hypothetical protein